MNELVTYNFFKASLRVQRYKESFSDLPLHPQSVIIRRGTRVNASKNYENIIFFWNCLITQLSNTK